MAQDPALRWVQLIPGGHWHRLRLWHDLDGHRIGYGNDTVCGLAVRKIQDIRQASDLSAAAVKCERCAEEKDEAATGGETEATGAVPGPA